MTHCNNHAPVSNQPGNQYVYGNVHLYLVRRDTLAPAMATNQDLAVEPWHPLA